MSSANVLDARGLFCPEPFLRTVSRMEEIGAEEHLTVLLSSPAAVEDIEYWASRKGIKVLKKQSEGFTELQLQK